MYRYHAYGNSLASELPFPELREVLTTTPYWTLYSDGEAKPTPEPPGVLLGSQQIYADCYARLFRTSNGLTITVDDTGRYELIREGREIRLSRFPGSSLDFARAHFLGRVLSTSMHFEGALVLHGSAVSFPGGAVAFLAPKHSGKSTLALALTLAGAKLISDDTIAVLGPESDGPLVRPGIHSLRLFPDTASRLAGDQSREERADGKQLISGLPSERLEEQTLPLAAVYLLAAAESIEGGAAADRRPLPRPFAAAALVGQGKITEMLGPNEGPVLLRRAAGIATRVPVYQLAVHRDLSRLGEVAARMAEWHGAVRESP